MAYVVGTLLIVLFTAWGMELFLPAGSGGQHLGDVLTTYLGVAHGWLYMVFLVMAALLARRARWPLGFTAATLLLGTVPVLSFVAERRATARVRAQLASEHRPESATTAV